MIICVPGGQWRRCGCPVGRTDKVIVLSLYCDRLGRLGREGIVVPNQSDRRYWQKQSQRWRGKCWPRSFSQNKKNGKHLLGKSEVAFLQKKIPGGVIGVLHLGGFGHDLLDQMGLGRGSILEAVGSGAEGGEAPSES